MKNIYHRAQIFVESLRVLSYAAYAASNHCDLYGDKSMTSVMEGKEGALLVGPTE